MSSRTTAQDDEMTRVEALPQVDASSPAARARGHRHGKPLKERTRRNGFDVDRTRRNDYRVISERALDACSTYEVQSVSLVAVKAT